MAVVLNWFTTNPDLVTYGFSYLNIIPKQFFGVVEVISILIFLITFNALFRKKIFVYTLIITFLVILFYLPYSNLWGGEVPNLILGIRNYTSMIPIFFGGYYISNKGGDLKPFAFLILILGLIQLPVTVFQYLFSLPFVKRGTDYDVISGTMGGISGNLMAIFLTSIILVLIRFYISLKKVWILIAILSMSIACILAEAKGIFVLLAFGVLVYILRGRISYTNKAKIVISSFLVLISISFAYTFLLDLDRQPWDPMYYIEYEAKKENRTGYDARLSRYQSVKYASELVISKPPAIILGLGLGNASLNNLYGKDGPYYSNQTILHYWDRTITELGFVGFFWMVLLLWRLSNIAKKVEKESSDWFISNIAGGLSVVLIVSVLAGFYTDHLSRVQFSYPLALITGFIVSEYVKIKKVRRTGSKHSLRHQI